MTKKREQDGVRLRNALVIVLLMVIVFAAIAALKDIRPAEHSEKAPKRETIVSGATANQRALARVIELADSGMAELAHETGEILYTPHEAVSAITLTVARNAVLDTAFGIDPLIEVFGAGTVFFEIRVGVGEQDPQTIFRDEIELGQDPDADLRWHTVTADLSDYEDQVVTLQFCKRIAANGEQPARAVYDLLPTDLTFWRVPHVRPRALTGRPNVILISIDTVRADHLHYMGYHRETSPNLDELAEGGVFFTNVASQAPWTTPAHFSILRSTYPSVHRGNQPIQVTRRRWNRGLPSMGSIFREQGYMTAAFTGRGSISAKFGFYQGFDFYNETAGRGHCESDVQPIFLKVSKWLNRNRDRSFCLFVHTYEPHAPYCDGYFVEREGIDEAESYQLFTAKYDGDIRRADGAVGALLRTLESLGLENTLIVVTSDHGEDIGVRTSLESALQFGHGHTLYDELLMVPLIFHGPGIVPSGVRVDPQIRSIDILPTILDYAGIEAPHSFEGKSLRSMIAGRDNRSRPALSESTTYGTERHSIRADGYKYIHRLSYGQLAGPKSQGLPLSPIDELFRLDTDPGELSNLALTNAEKVEYFKDLIRSMLPDSTSNSDDQPESLTDIGEDEELMERLKSLGYL